VLGFGCGNVGGLMVRGALAERARAVARAVELGINYFDTAPSYGDGRSEEHLGQALRAVGAPVLVGTKVRLAPAELAALPEAIERSLAASLQRLGMERVDLFQLHNLIGTGRAGEVVAAADVLDGVVPVLERLREQGRIGFYGVTALGEPAALHRVLGAGRLHTAQVCLNLLNPSAAVAVPPGFPAPDFGRLLDRAREHAVGVIVIRVLAAGALSGGLERHPVAVPAVDPIASGPDYATDVRRAQTLAALVREGHAGSLVEAALRFPLGVAAVSTVLLGYSSLEHLEAAAAAMAKGPLPPAAHARLEGLWRGLAAA
jgi:aryl-alcohol dehydrogenase-like predicted oxidoreductase